MSARKPGGTLHSGLVVLAAYGCLTGAAATVLLVWGPRLNVSVAPSTVVVLAVAFLLTGAVSTKLPQGDEVRIDQMVGLTGLWLASIGTLLLAVILGGLAEVIMRRLQHQAEGTGRLLLDTLRRTAVIGLLSPVYVLRSDVSSDASLIPILAVGLLYIFVDVATVAVQQRIFASADGPRGLLSVFRPLASVYLVHIAMAAVVVRVYSELGLWAFFVALLMTLILQNGLNLYMRIRRAYTETIGALAQAAELDRPADAGHAKRVADLSIALGRRVGIAGRELERLGYAALLHDVGRIGHQDADTDIDHAARGAQIVESIPFLETVAPLIARHHDKVESLEDSPPMGAMVVGVCSDFDRLRAKHGSTLALQRLTASERGERARLVSELIRIVSARRGAV